MHTVGNDPQTGSRRMEINSLIGVSIAKDRLDDSFIEIKLVLRQTTTFTVDNTDRRQLQRIGRQLLNFWTVTDI